MKNKHAKSPGRQSLQRTREMEQSSAFHWMICSIDVEESSELNLVVKADVQGSVEALEQALEKIDQQDAAARVVGGVGRS